MDQDSSRTIGADAVAPRLGGDIVRARTSTSNVSSIAAFGRMSEARISNFSSIAAFGRIAQPRTNALSSIAAALGDMSEARTDRLARIVEHIESDDVIGEAADATGAGVIDLDNGPPAIDPTFVAFALVCVALVELASEAASSAVFVAKLWAALQDNVPTIRGAVDLLDFLLNIAGVWALAKGVSKDAMSRQHATGR